MRLREDDPADAHADEDRGRATGRHIARLVDDLLDVRGSRGARSGSARETVNVEGRSVDLGSSRPPVP